MSRQRARRRSESANFVRTAAKTWFFVAVLSLSFSSGGAAGGGPERASSTCGRENYPTPANFSADAVTNLSLWDALRAQGGFANGSAGMSPVEVRVTEGTVVHVVRLEEILVRRYVGGSPTDVPVVALHVRDEDSGVPRPGSINFTALDLGRAGGNLTLVAWTSGGALEIFWRWAYLACDEAYPNAYYVFHGRVTGGAVSDDNTLVYFDAPRPRRGPPADLILLVVAGVAASAIFLYARYGLKRKTADDDSRDRTIK